jgi:hypothetical protein
MLVILSAYLSPMWGRYIHLSRCLQIHQFLLYCACEQCNCVNGHARHGHTRLRGSALLALVLFLRLFPQIMRLATRLVAKMRSAPAVLALAQMERTPRSAARIIVLLALAVSSACFLFTLIASKEQRNIDLATFATEAADFSGSLPTTDASKTFSQLMTYYSGLPGVQSVTLGYHDVIQLSRDLAYQLYRPRADQLCPWCL